MGHFHNQRELSHSGLFKCAEVTDIMRGLSVALSAEHVYDSIYSVGLILLYFKVEFHYSTFLTVSGE